MVIEPNLALSIASENTYNNCADKVSRASRQPHGVEAEICKGLVGWASQLGGTREIKETMMLTSFRLTMTKTMLFQCFDS